MLKRRAAVAVLTLTVAACANGTRNEIVEVSSVPDTKAPTEQSQPSTTSSVVITVPPTTSTTLPDLTGVDWIGLAEYTAAQQAEEELAMRHDYIDEQRMLHGPCGEWHDLALEVGWHEEEWPTLSTVLFTESRCDPLAWNGHDAGGTQINQIHKDWAAQMGFNWPEDFFDPRVNLTFAYRLYSSREEKGLCGWKPWTEPCR